MLRGVHAGRPCGSCEVSTIRLWQCLKIGQCRVKRSIPRSAQRHRFHLDTARQACGLFAECAYLGVSHACGSYSLWAFRVRACESYLALLAVQAECWLGVSMSSPAHTWRGPHQRVWTHPTDRRAATFLV